MSAMDATRGSQGYEQLIHTWALRTLEGSGAGIVAATRGWPTARSSLDPEVASMVDFLPQGSALAIERGAVPPTAVEFGFDRAGHRQLVVKRYAGDDAAGRPGRAIVHALIDPSMTLTARSACRLALSGALARDWAFDAVPDPELDRFDPTRVPASEEATPMSDSRTAALMAIILEVLTTRIPVVVQRVGDPLPLLDSVLVLLPSALTRDLTFSTYRADPRDSDALLTFESESFGTPWTTGPQRVIPLDEVVATGPAARVIDAITAGRVLPDGLDSLASIEAHLALEQAVEAGPGQATIDQIRRVLSSDRGLAWWETAGRAAELIDRLTAGDPAAVRDMAGDLRGTPIGERVAGVAVQEAVNRLSRDPVTAARQAAIARQFAVDPWRTHQAIVGRLSELFEASSLGAAHRAAFPEEFARVVAVGRATSRDGRPAGEESLRSVPAGPSPGSAVSDAVPSGSPSSWDLPRSPSGSGRARRRIAARLGALTLVVLSAVALGIWGPGVATWGALAVTTATAAVVLILGERTR